MSLTAIPLQFEKYLQNQISVGNGPDMNEMIFAYIPDLDLTQPIDRSQGLPDVSLWVHQQDIDQVGKLGDNALVYSVVIPGSVDAFTFNAIYLRDKNVPNSCGMVVHKADETKENGMASTKSLMQQYTGASQIAGIDVDAATWQIDYQARLLGIEDDMRLANVDTYGHAAFVDGFEVVQQADPTKYAISPGVAYVGGLRAVLDDDIIQTINTKPNGLYLDVVRMGTALSQWQNVVTIRLSPVELSDYVDGSNQQHFVAKLAGINADGTIADWRVKGGLKVHETSINPHPQYAIQKVVDGIKTVLIEGGVNQSVRFEIAESGQLGFSLFYNGADDNATYLQSNIFGAYRNLVKIPREVARWDFLAPAYYSGYQLLDKSFVASPTEVVAGSTTKLATGEGVLAALAKAHSNGMLSPTGSYVFPKDENGLSLIIQWGIDSQVTGQGNGDKTVILPITFPNGIFLALTTPGVIGATSGDCVGYVAGNQTNFTYNWNSNNATGFEVSWFALGY
ncbi:phage tail protein [Vibrio fluvialis]|nr:phage tail protein [Vibrio fluvialis]